ncbi:MAG: cation transporter [Gemmatimonadota bacterium]|nr:cation transporter [Gemmatimonadota bacterium]
MPQLTLQISGMTCGHCVASVTRALSAVPGVTVDTVTIGNASVQFDPARTTPAAIAQAVEEDGYQVVSSA